MRFKDKILTKVMPFKNDWVRSHILAPDVLMASIDKVLCFAWP